MRLTAKQSAFVNAYLKSGNASKAYRKAYDAENMKDSAIRVNASKLLKNANIALAVDAARQKVQRRSEISVERLTQWLQKALDKAMSEPKGASAAVSAIMGIGKLHGLVVDKKEVTRKRDASDFDDAELLEIARMGRSGASEAQAGTEEPDSLH